MSVEGGREDIHGMKIEGIHHVQLAMPAGAEERAVAFYEGVLGLRQVDKPPHLVARGGCWFESGDVRVHLGVEEPFQPANKAHPAFVVEQIDVAREHLEHHQTKVIVDTQLPGFDRFYLNDPFGNRLEILSAST